MEQTAAAHARAVTVPHELMPDGHNVILIERDGDAVWAIREGCTIEDGLDEFNAELGHATTSGL